MKISYQWLIVLIILLTGCNKDFDSNVWIQNQETVLDNPRWEMLDDLESKIKIKKTSVKEIRVLLGNPDYEENYSSLKYLHYFVGHNSGFQIDPDFLVLTIGSDSLLLEFKTEQR